MSLCLHLLAQAKVGNFEFNLKILLPGASMVGFHKDGHMYGYCVDSKCYTVVYYMYIANSNINTFQVYCYNGS